MSDVRKEVWYVYEEREVWGGERRALVSSIA